MRVKTKPSQFFVAEGHNKQPNKQTKNPPKINLTDHQNTD